jgi:hypothetical protein
MGAYLFVTQNWVIIGKSHQISEVRVSKALKAVTVHSLFGPRPVVEGEDAAAYDELFGRVCAAVKPADVIDEILVADLVALEWEVLRWRRLKSSLIQVSALKALKGFLEKQLGYDLYREEFEDDLAKILRENLGGTKPKTLRVLPIIVRGRIRTLSPRSTRFSTVLGST